MGLIKAIFGATGGVLADQWKEYFYCDALPADVICARGHKKTSGILIFAMSAILLRPCKIQV